MNCLKNQKGTKSLAKISIEKSCQELNLVSQELIYKQCSERTTINAAAMQCMRPLGS